MRTNISFTLSESSISFIQPSFSDHSSILHPSWTSGGINPQIWSFFLLGDRKSSTALLDPTSFPSHHHYHNRCPWQNNERCRRRPENKESASLSRWAEALLPSTEVSQIGGATETRRRANNQAASIFGRISQCRVAQHSLIRDVICAVYLIWTVAFPFSGASVAA